MLKLFNLLKKMVFSEQLGQDQCKEFRTLGFLQTEFGCDSGHEPNVL